jgi:hypothetical protein
MSLRPTFPWDPCTVTKNHFVHNLLPAPIRGGSAWHNSLLVARTKHTTVLGFLRERNDVEIEETTSLVPVV